jgi:hypothetical protein
MKHQTLVASLLLPIFSILASTAHGQQAAPPYPPLISTNGSAEIHVTPDLADLSFEIEIRNPDLTAARNRESALTARVLAALRAAGIDEKLLQTSQATVDTDWTGDRRVETDAVKFYRVTQSISCTLTDVSKVPDITADALAAGATEVSPVILRSSEMRKFRDQARALAIRAAREKAVALASELGGKIGKPYSIDEYEPFRWAGSNPMSNSVQTANTPPAGGSDTPLPTYAPGMIIITANIHVAFLLE